MKNKFDTDIPLGRASPAPIPLCLLEDEFSFVAKNLNLSKLVTLFVTVCNEVLQITNLSLAF